jgi:hypothetical protein
MTKQICHALLSASFLLLAACGPGTGGSGGAPETGYLAQAGADAVPVCAAAWAGRLDCVPAIVPGVAVDALHPGTQRVQFASSADRPEFVLSFEGNHVTLQSACARTGFDGDWGSLAGAPALYFGAYSDALFPASIGAHLSVQAAADAATGQPQLQLELRADDDGRLLFGPLPLQKISGAEVKPRACS